MPVRNRSVVAFEQVLIDPESFIQGTNRAFEPPGGVIALSVIEALGIDPRHAEDNTQVTVLGEERVLVNEPEQADERAHGSGVEVLPGDLADADHTGLRTILSPTWSRFAGSYWVLNREELRRMRRICGSVPVAQRASK